MHTNQREKVSLCDKDDNYFKDLAKEKLVHQNDQEQEFIDSLSKHQDVWINMENRDIRNQINKQILDNINSGDLDQHNAILWSWKMH